MAAGTLGGIRPTLHREKALRAEVRGLEGEGAGRGERSASAMRKVRALGAQPLAFTAASASCALLDWAGVLAIHAATGSLLAAVIGARIVSASTNYAIGRKVFADRGPVGHSAVRYLLLALGLMAASYLGLRMAVLALPLWLAKPVVDSSLYVASFLAQKKFVYRNIRGSL